MLPLDHQSLIGIMVPPMKLFSSLFRTVGIRGNIPLNGRAAAEPDVVERAAEPVLVSSRSAAGAARHCGSWCLEPHVVSHCWVSTLA